MDTPLVSYAPRVALELQRSEEEILEQLAKLQQHWVTTVGDWNWLSAEKRVELGLPLLLNSVVDSVVASAVAESRKKSRAGGQPPAVVVEERTHRSLRLRIAGRAECCDAGLEDSVEFALVALVGDAAPSASIIGSSGHPFAHDALVADAFVPGSTLTWLGPAGAQLCACVTTEFELTSVDRWLARCGLESYSHRFFKEGIKDFLLLPLLRTSALERMVDAHGAAVLSDEISVLLSLEPCELAVRWVEFLGMEHDCRSALEENGVTVQILLSSDCFQLEDYGIPPHAARSLASAIRTYREYSSVEAAYEWLHENELGIYAVQFAKSNIPFYILPLVNYFIVYEMGIVIDDQGLYKRLRKLSESPVFTAKAVSLWLRDMELGGFQANFGKMNWNSLLEFSRMPREELLWNIDGEKAQNSFLTGLTEMEEFMYFHETTTSILDELGMDEYSELFALHGVSINMLPFLTDLHLKCMGIASLTERTRVLGVISKVQKLATAVGQDPLASAVGAGYRELVDNSVSRWAAGASGGGMQPATLAPQIGDTRTVEEWMKFINESDQKPAAAKKKRKRKRKKKKKKKGAAAGDGQAMEPAMEPAVEAVAVLAVEPVVEPTVEPTVETGASDPATPSPATEDFDEQEDDAQMPDKAGGVETVPVKPPVCEETLLLGPSLKEAQGMEPAADWTSTEPHVPMAFETNRLSGLEPAKPSKVQPFSPEMIPLEELFLNDEFSDEDDMDPELKAQLDKEVEEFRRRLESTHSKSKLTPIFFLPD